MHVVGVCSAAHAAEVRDLGAEDTFDYSQGAEALRQRYGSAKFDFIFDVVGGAQCACML